MAYPFEDEERPQHISRMGLGDQFVIWSVRTWLRAHLGDGQTSHHYLALLRKTYAIAGMNGGDIELDSLMSTILAVLARPLRAHYPKCSGISDDELLILGAVCDGQAGKAENGAARLGTLTRTGAAEGLAAKLASYATRLEAKGLFCRRYRAYADTSMGGTGCDRVGLGPKSGAIVH